MLPLPTASTAPKVARPAAKARGTPRIEIRRPKPEPQSPLPMVAGIFLIVVGSAFAVFSGRETPDPHLLRARELVTKYEQGKPEATRDYEDPAYEQAIAELAMVERTSRAAREADVLAADLRARRQAQLERVRVREAATQAASERQQRRDEEFFRAQRMERGNPSPSPD